jgi:SSS family solute:Na+ symporter/sodium/pantothenate symporter
MAWALFIAYLAGTAYLGWLGYRRTTGFSSFALGNKDIHPIIVGITLAASTASASTFIINPGFVYVDGFSAWFHMVVGVAVGFLAMLYVLSFRFRSIGEQSKALTIPDWIGKRYRSR